MKVITLNLNGIRSAASKGLFSWLIQQQADIICLQELKAQEHQLTDTVFQLSGYHRYLYPAQKKGYSGVGIYTKHTPHRLKH